LLSSGCTEGVRWLVLSDPEGISPSELHTFSAIYPHNARPTQAVNGRIVKESE
jgi:carbonic anhydrase